MTKRFRKAVSVTGRTRCRVARTARGKNKSIKAVDEAGNETKVSLIIGPSWLKDGSIGEGEFYLETGEEYHMPSDSNWRMSGDDTVYMGGNDFYANKEGQVTFSKE